MPSASLILGIIAVIGLFFLLRWLIPSKGKVGEKVVAGKLDRLPPFAVGIRTLAVPGVRPVHPPGHRDRVQESVSGRSIHNKGPVNLTEPFN